MFWYRGLLSSLLLAHVFGDVPTSRIRRQNLAQNGPGTAQNGQLIDNIFNIPITAIRETASAAQVFSPENTQTIDSIFKIPVSTLEAVGSLVKSTAEQRRQNAENIQRIRQERRDRLLARKEQKLKLKEKIQNQRLSQEQSKRVVRHHHNDPFGLNALSDLLIGHRKPLGGLIGGHHIGGLIGHHSGSHGHSFHGGHGSHGPAQGTHGGHGGHGWFSENRPQNTYAVHEDVNEDGPSFSWHGLTAGFNNFFGTRPTGDSVKIENKIAPKERKQKIVKYPNNANLQNKYIGHEWQRGDDDPPLENKIAPRTAKVTFVR